VVKRLESQIILAILGPRKPDLILILVFNVTFSNISAISWRPVLVVEEAKEGRKCVLSFI
jgi:hypothetical protein